MAEKSPRCTLAVRYASMPAEKRELIPDAARRKILAQSFSRGEEAAAVAKDVLRAAEIRLLLSEPFTDSARVGHFASLILETLPEQAVVLCLFTKDKRFLEQYVLAYGDRADPAQYAPRIPGLFKKSGASFAALMFAPRAAVYGYTLDDLRLASRVAMYCQQNGIPLIECVVAQFQKYVPLLRLYGHK